MNGKFQFHLPAIGEPETTKLAAYVFDRQNNFVASAPLEKDSFHLELDDATLRNGRIIIAPELPPNTKDITLESFKRKKPWEVFIPDRLGDIIELDPIPDHYFDHWRLCICTIKGKVLNSRCDNPNTPVPGAKVHICEVDSIFEWLQIWPDWKIINIRDWIINHILPDHYYGRNPIIKWPPIGPDPSPIEDLVRGKFKLQANTRSTRSLEFNPLLQVRNEQLSATFAGAAKMAEKLLNDQQALFFSEEKIPAADLLPAANRHLFFSADASAIRKYLVDYYDIIFIPICRYLSWLYTYDELRVVTTDANGNFSTTIKYDCSDHPDIYVWIEYPVDMAWKTIYRPWVGCNTFFNYQCGTDILIHVNSPYVPCISEPDVNVGPKSVVVLSMGEWVNVAHVEQGPGTTGIPRAGAFTGGPFGSTVEPRVYFHKSLALDVNNPGGLNYFYRWSYRRQGATGWSVMGTPVTRHYEEIVPPGIPIFPAYQVGPDSQNLFRIVRHYTPDNQPIIPKYASDLADGYFETGGLESGHPELADGLYEVKLELYKYVAGVPQLVNWTAEAINLYIPTDDIISFQGTTITVETNPTTMAPYEYRMQLIGGVLTETAIGDLYGFKMKMFVDNNAPEISLDKYFVDIPAKVPNCCGFVQYDDLATSVIHLELTAKQKNNFADFSVGAAGYESHDTDPYIPSGAGAFVMSKTLQTDIGFAEITVGAGKYAGNIPVMGALAGCTPPCTKKVITIGLDIDWYAHNGSGRLWGSRNSTSTAFAIEPTEI